MDKRKKIYNSFNEIVDEAKKGGGIKLAYFTTFNLNIEFFEKYILSSLAGIDPNSLRTVYDYEGLNLTLFKEDKSKVDVKLFCDYRAIEPRIKKTCVPTFPINPKKIKKEFTNGVFHPKVSLIVNNENRGWVIVGSNNLTLSAYSKNIECFHIKEVKDKKNANEIGSFFKKLLKVKKQDSTKLNEFIKNINLKESDEWIFQSSISGSNFISTFFSDKPNKLKVWSPYFSENLKDIIDSENFKNIQDLSIIPDVSNKERIRMSEKVKNDISGKVEFYRSEINNDSDRLIHAKVWLSESKLGIGSWNFSDAGIGYGNSNNKNVEAGIIEDINEEKYRNLLKSFDLKKINPATMPTDEIKEDRKDLAESKIASCQVIADWDKCIYSIEKTEEDLNYNIYFDLPGFKDKFSLASLKEGVSFFNQQIALLKDRLFNIYDEKENKLLSGIILEINIKDRETFCFESINDLLHSWGDEKPENETHRHRNLLDLDEGSALDTFKQSIRKGDYSNAWFSMFIAFEQMNNRLILNENKKQNLIQIGYKIPGNLTELRNHLINLINDNDNSFSKPFIWYMINEFNQVVLKFNSIINQKDWEIGRLPKFECIKNINLDEIKEVEKTNLLNFFKESCGYV